MDNTRKNTLVFPGLTVNYQSELMENYISESIINPGSGLKVVRRNLDDAVIFFISKKNVLTALLSDSGNRSGWLEYQLSNENGKATAFDIFWEEQTRVFRLAFAQVQNGKSELKISKPLNLDNINPSDFATQLLYGQPILQDTQREINLITMDKGGLLFGSKLKNTDAKYHYCTYESQPENFALPENTNQVKQLKLGKLSGKFGVFILYDMPGQSRTMLFQSFRRPDQKEVTMRRFAIENDIDCFDLVSNERGDSMVFLGGKGIILYENHKAEKKVIADASITFTKISLCSDGSRISIWAIGKAEAGSGLYYLSNTFHKRENGKLAITEEWTRPLQMHGHIEEFASMRGENFINQLFLFGQTPDGEGLIHFWQDGVSTGWQESFPSLPSLSAAVEVSSYTIDLDFSFDPGKQALDNHLNLEAQENIVIYINNRKYALVKDKPVRISFHNSVNILYPTESLAMPKITIDAEFLSSPIQIDPTGGIRKELSKTVKTGKDLSKMLKQDGTPLVSAGIDQATLDQVAVALGAILEQGEQMSKGEQGGKFEEIHLKFESSDSSSSVALEMAFSDTFGNTIGDIWHSVKKGFNEITGFIIRKVDNVINFIVEIGGKIIEWVVDTVKSAVAFLERIWEKIKVFFKDLYETLAFLFGWDDILLTKDALKQIGRSYFVKAKESIGDYKQMAVDYILEIREKYQQRDKAIQDKYMKKDNLLDLLSDNSKKETVDSRTNWISSKKDVMMSGEAKVSASLINEEQGEDFMAKNLEQDIPAEVGKLILQLLKGEIGFGEFFEKFVSKIALLAIDLVKKITELFFDLIFDTVDFIEKMLFTPMEIPLISYLYKKISGSELSVADFIALLIAIPTTVGYKLANGTAPFKTEDREFINTLSFN